jgi:hypothetical protein
MKGVQASGEVPEESLDDVVSEKCFDLPLVAHPKYHQLERVREERQRQYVEQQRSGKTSGVKVNIQTYCAFSLYTNAVLEQGEGQGEGRSG